MCFNRPFHFKFPKGCIPQILLGPFLNKCRPLRSKKKCPTYLYLLKAIFCVNEILGAKIRENGGWQHFYPTHSQKYDVIIFTVSEIFFSKYLDSLASNWKISLTGEKNSQKLWSENFFFRRYYSLNNLQNTDQ